MAAAAGSGVFHLALLVPERPSLAQAVRRVVESGQRFTGASDHFVSEALYLRDPEGNGIEIYRDRPRSEWEYDANGEILALLFGSEKGDSTSIVKWKELLFALPLAGEGAVKVAGETAEAPAAL